jgi:hypothetical protein
VAVGEVDSWPSGFMICVASLAAVDRRPVVGVVARVGHQGRQVAIKLHIPRLLAAQEGLHVRWQPQGRGGGMLAAIEERIAQ